MSEILQLKITLEESDPVIWRTIQVETSITFLELHHIIQITMGWKNYHLFEFIADDLRIGLPNEDDDFFEDDKLEADEALVFNFVEQAGTTIKYEYDFGDCWEHQILVEKILPKDSKTKYPICIDGALHCPPEDSGGIDGYYEKLDTLKDPTDEEHEHIKEWMGKNFDPEKFDIKKVNKELSNLKAYIKKWNN